MKEDFNKTFANVPIPERMNTIYVDEKHGPMSWYVVNLEVRCNTKIGMEALEFLKKMNII